MYPKYKQTTKELTTIPSIPPCRDIFEKQSNNQE